MTGKVFGKLTVLSYSHDAPGYQKCWLCKCECGNVKVIRQQHLVSGHTTSCGCEKFTLNDYTGLVFGDLTVLGRAEDYVCPGNGKHYVRYDCICTCGKVLTVNALNLKNGTTRSCGCKRPHGQFEDLSGKKFGNLTVVHRVDDYVNPAGRKLVRYLCKCDCGNEVLVLANALRNGDTGSCGCILRSRGEELVRDWLNEHGIQYEIHKTFDGCVSPSGYKLSYDFWIPEFSILVECNGIQHYEAVEFFGGAKQLQKQKLHDSIKRQFAMEQGYHYLELDCRNFEESRILNILCESIL